MEEGKGTLAFLDFLAADMASGQQCFIYEHGQTIFRQGDPCPCMHLILQGSVEIRQEREGKEILVARLQPPDFFGEVALLTGVPHVTMAVAVERTCLLSVSLAQLLKEVGSNRELALYLVRSLILRLSTPYKPWQISRSPSWYHGFPSPRSSSKKSPSAWQ